LCRYKRSTEKAADKVLRIRDVGPVAAVRTGAVRVQAERRHRDNGAGAAEKDRAARVAIATAPSGCVVRREEVIPVGQGGAEVGKLGRGLLALRLELAQQVRVCPLQAVADNGEALLLLAGLGRQRVEEAGLRYRSVGPDRDRLV
jgi:hypothetical protein